MARVVLIFVVLAFLFIQLTSSQDACQVAKATLTSNAARCTPTTRIICDDPCRRYYSDIFDSCTPEVSKLNSYNIELAIMHAF